MACGCHQYLWFGVFPLFHGELKCLPKASYHGCPLGNLGAITHRWEFWNNRISTSQYQRDNMKHLLAIAFHNFQNLFCQDAFCFKQQNIMRWKLELKYTAKVKENILLRIITAEYTSALTLLNVLEKQITCELVRSLTHHRLLDVSNPWGNYPHSTGTVDMVKSLVISAAQRRFSCPHCTRF